MRKRHNNKQLRRFMDMWKHDSYWYPVARVCELILNPTKRNINELVYEATKSLPEVHGNNLTQAQDIAIAEVARLAQCGRMYERSIARQKKWEEERLRR